MTARAPRVDLTEPEHVFVEFCRCLQVAHFERHMVDFSHWHLFSRKYRRSEFWRFSRFLDPPENARPVSFNLTRGRFNRQGHTSPVAIYSHVEPHILRY